MGMMVFTRYEIEFSSRDAASVAWKGGGGGSVMGCVGVQLVGVACGAVSQAPYAGQDDAIGGHGRQHAAEDGNDCLVGGQVGFVRGIEAHERSEAGGQCADQHGCPQSVGD